MCRVLHGCGHCRRRCGLQRPLNTEFVVGCEDSDFKAPAVQGRASRPESPSARYRIRTIYGISLQNLKCNFTLLYVERLPFQRPLLFRELHYFTVHKHAFALSDTIHISLGNIRPVCLFAKIF